MAEQATPSPTYIDPIVRAQSDALRAIRALGDVRSYPSDTVRRADRDLLESALGAALALRVDVEAALIALNRAEAEIELAALAEPRWLTLARRVEQLVSEIPEGEARALDGNR